MSELLYLAVPTLYSAFRRRKVLIVENLLLRHELQVAPESALQPFTLSVAGHSLAPPSASY